MDSYTQWQRVRRDVEALMMGAVGLGWAQVRHRPSRSRRSSHRRGRIQRRLVIRPGGPVDVVRRYFMEMPAEERAMWARIGAMSPEELHALRVELRLAP